MGMTCKTIKNRFGYMKTDPIGGIPLVLPGYHVGNVADSEFYCNKLEWME